MSEALQLTARLASCADRNKREAMYQGAERDYGKNFAEHLRDQIEAHHLIVANEGIRRCYHGISLDRDCEKCAESYGNARPTRI